jgi:hypothetical protein
MSIRASLNPFTRWFLVAVAIIVFSLLADLSRTMWQYGRVEQAGKMTFSVSQAFQHIARSFLWTDSVRFVAG